MGGSTRQPNKATQSYSSVWDDPFGLSESGKTDHERGSTDRENAVPDQSGWERQEPAKAKALPTNMKPTGMMTRTFQDHHIGGYILAKEGTWHTQRA
jgi:hypothetical protein